MCDKLKFHLVVWLIYKMCQNQNILCYNPSFLSFGGLLFGRILLFCRIPKFVKIKNFICCNSKFDLFCRIPKLCRYKPNIC